MSSSYEHSSNTNTNQRPQTRRDSRRITSTASEQFMISSGGGGGGEEVGDRSKSKFTMPRPPSTPKQQQNSADSASSGENRDTKKRNSPRRNHYKVSSREDDYESTNYEVKENSVYSKQHSKPMYNDYKRSSIDNSQNDDPLQILTSDASDRPISSRLSRFTAPLPPIGSTKPKHENVKLESIEDSKIKSLIKQQKSHENRERSFDTDTQSTQHHHQHLPTTTTSQPKVNKQQKSSTHEEFESNFENMKIESERHHSHHHQPKIKIPPEPDEDNPDRLLIGIRLPDGSMIERYFLRSNKMQNILDFASLSANKDFNKPNVRLIELPRRHIDDLTKTLEYYKLQNRTRLTIIHEEND